MLSCVPAKICWSPNLQYFRMWFCWEVELLTGYCSVAKSCPTLCDPMDCSTPSFRPPLSPRVCSNSCPLSQWCHPTISFNASPFSSCLLQFAASGSFPMSRLFASGGLSIRISASASVLSINIQGWFPSDLFDLLAVQGTLKNPPAP